MLESTRDYADASRKYMERAWGYLAEDDLPQASEKGWGAAAEIVKAVAEERGWVHSTHRVMFRNVRRLIDETGDEELIRLFGLAHNLHSNFYENWLALPDVRIYLEAVETLRGRLEPLLGEG